MPSITYELMNSDLTITEFLSACGVGTIIGLIIIYFIWKYA
jgi:uncharacterized membrane protein (Fun14 family)